MSKDFDTILTDAIDLAAGAAQAPGASAARNRGRKRSMRKRTALVAASLVLVAAAGTAVGIGTTSGNRGTSQTTDEGTPGASAGPSTSADSYSGPLKNLLVPIPAKATPLAPRQGTSGGELTVGQYVADDFAGDNSLQAGATEQILGAFGFKSATVQWYSDGLNNAVETYLLQFSDPDGAKGFGLGLAGSRVQNGKAAEFPDSTAVTGYGFSLPAATGYTESDLFGYSGDILVIVHVVAKGNPEASAAAVFASQYSAVESAR